MNLSIGPVPTTEKLGDLSRWFQRRWEKVAEIARPALKGLEKSQWGSLHTKLLTIIIEGNEIAFRSTLYCELRLITPTAAWKLSQQLESHARDISRTLKIIHERDGRESLEKELKLLKTEALQLQEEMKELAHFIHP